MTTYAVRRPSLVEGKFVYWHEAAPHWRSSPPLPGRRLCLADARRLAKFAHAKVVRFTTRRDRVEKLLEAAHIAWMSCLHGRMGLSGLSLEPTLKPFLCGTRPGRWSVIKGARCGEVPCHDDNGPIIHPCILLRGHEGPCHCEHGTDW